MKIIQHIPNFVSGVDPETYDNFTQYSLSSYNDEPTLMAEFYEPEKGRYWWCVGSLYDNTLDELPIFTSRG